jgi:enoyl-CoA hydratase
MLHHLLQELRNGVLTITINRPDKLNALNRQTIDELHQALSTAASNPEVRVIIITGSGDKAFVAGADIAEFASFSVEQGKMLSEEGHRKLFSFTENMPKPVIAAVNGFALGGGFELALSCHVRIASEKAKIGLPEVGLGVIPGYGGTQRVAALAGKGKAFELILTGDMMTANDALACGLVNQVVAPELLLSVAQTMAEKMASRSASALSAAIKAVNASFPSSAHGYAKEIEEFGHCFGTPDFVEGTSAFLEKRKPEFKTGISA